MRADPLGPEGPVGLGEVRIPSETDAIQNRLLRALTPDDLERLEPHLVPVSFKRGQVLHSANRPIEHVHFIEEGVISVLTDPDRGDLVEVWLIGCEGLTGIPALLGVNTTFHQYAGLTKGRALRINAAKLRDAMHQSRTLADTVLRFVQVILVQTSRIGACNAQHSLRHRLIRSLLMTRNRAVRDDLPLTHDLLAHMLDVRRAGVTEAINGLEADGLIQNTRGHIVIVDRDRLEAASCRCYGMVHAGYDQILGGPKVHQMIAAIRITSS